MNPSEDLPEEVRDRAYHSQPVWKRMAVIAAGPFVNFVLAFVLLLGFNALLGPRNPSTEIGTVQGGWPAAGKLKPGDKVQAVDGKAGTPLQLSHLIAAHHCAGAQQKGCHSATPVKVTVLRDGRRLTFAFVPRYDPAAGKVRIG